MGSAAISADALVRITDSEVKRLVDEKWQLIEEHFSPVHVILFGSRINGIPHEWSDIDLIVVSERFAEIRHVNRGFRFKSVIRPHIGMDVLCYTPEEFEEMRTGIGVVPDACREGLWLK